MKDQNSPLDHQQQFWSEWAELANFINLHQDLINDLEPLPATVPGKHSNLKKLGREGLLNIVVELCMWIHHSCDTAEWLLSQHSDNEEHMVLWKAALQ